MSILLQSTDTQLFIAVKAWLQFLLGLDNLHVVRELVNRVPTPTPPFALMTHVSQTRLSTNDNFGQPTTSPASTTAQNNMDYCMQVDVFGADSGSMAMTISTAFRSAWAVEFFKAYGIAPLWADPATETPFINGEQQYEERWLTRLHLQYKPGISFAQTFAHAATISIDREGQ